MLSLQVLCIFKNEISTVKNHVGSYIRGFQKAHLNLLNIVYCTKMYYGGLTHSRM